MPIKFFAVIGMLFTIFIFSCSKKYVPQQSNDVTVINTTKPEIKKVVIKKSPPVPVAKVIMLNDSVAKKNIDGRLYYDVGGHRYWRNYNDGKYYLFNKSMYTDPAFKPH